jgi:hypothetical protein
MIWNDSIKVKTSEWKECFQETSELRATKWVITNKTQPLVCFKAGHHCAVTSKFHDKAIADKKKFLGFPSSNILNSNKDILEKLFQIKKKSTP